MIRLSPDEARVLGVLVEKAQTTPAQYPLSLNALAAGCSQKNNRDPVEDYTEERGLAALDSLRAKGLVREAMLSGSRVHKFKHVAREALGVSLAELVVLSELLLRGAQSPGELRGRAVRMMPQGDDALATLEGAQRVLDGLASRPEPLVERLAPRPGERAERYAQRLCPDAHAHEARAALGAVAAGVPRAGGAPADLSGARGAAPLGGSDGDRLVEVLARLEKLERQLASVEALVERLTDGNATR